jgi:hypothetical protein
MGKIKVSFEVDCDDLAPFPTKKAEDHPFLVSNVGQLLYDLFLHKLDMQTRVIAQAKEMDAASKKALLYHYACDQHFALQMIDTLQIESVMDDGTTHKFVQDMPKHKYPDVTQPEGVFAKE